MPYDLPLIYSCCICHPHSTCRHPYMPGQLLGCNTLKQYLHLYRRELPPDNALLRLKHFHDHVPAANHGNAASHLINHALHAVTRRLQSSPDPRMCSLQSVQHLQRLWVGDRSNVKLGRRQPVRRRRGDVHKDLSAVVLHLHWHGGPLYAVSCLLWGHSLVKSKYACLCHLCGACSQLCMSDACLCSVHICLACSPGL